MINFDQIYARTPLTSLTGSEIVLLQNSGVTGGSLLSTLKNFFKAGFVSDDVSDASTLGKDVLTVADLAAAKTLLEIPTLPTPLAPVTLSASITLDDTHVNRRIFVDTDSITLTLDSTSTLNTDTLEIINVSAGAIDIDAGVAEDIIVEGGTSVTTYSLPANSKVRAYLVDSDTWFFEI